MAWPAAPVPRPPQPTSATFISPANETYFFVAAGSLFNIKPAAVILAEWPKNVLRSI